MYANTKATEKYYKKRFSLSLDLININKNNKIY